MYRGVPSSGGYSVSHHACLELSAWHPQTVSTHDQYFATWPAVRVGNTPPAACQAKLRGAPRHPPRLWRRPSTSASDTGAESSLLLPGGGDRVLTGDPRISTSMGCFLGPAVRLPAGRAAPPLWWARRCPGVEALRRWRWPAMATARTMRWPLSMACRQTDHAIWEWQCSQLLSVPPS